MHFEPIFPEHAIERCSATVLFHQPVPDKFFATIRPLAVEYLSKMGLLQAQAPQIGFQINFAANQVVPMASMATPMSFHSNDGGVAVIIANNSIVYQTSNYVRWSPFIGQFQEFIEPIIMYMKGISSVSLIKLDYVDRFFWAGDWKDIDYSQLIQDNSPMIANNRVRGPQEWHSHIGWFDYLGDHRRLFNVNVDVFEMQRAGRDTPAPSVGILTMAQDQPFATDMQAPVWAEGQAVASVLEEQHIELHRLLASLITARTAQQIGLRPIP